MPPRTPNTTATPPAGRRPKVAGLRAPGRREVTGESGPSSTVAEHEDDTLRPEEEMTAAPPGGRPPASHADAPAQEEPAPSVSADGSTTEDEAGGVANPTPVGKPVRPEPDARRAGRTMTPGTAESAPRRGGTALLDRPRAARDTSTADAAPEPGRLGRLAGAVTRPVAALGANPRRLVTLLVVVMVLSLGLGTWAFVAARADRADGTAYANEAVVNVGGTAEVVGQTRQAMEQILSYDFTKLDDSVNAAKSQATGSFASEYLSVFEQTIRKPATDQKLRQTASVLNIGVEQLSSDRATLMALVQFTAERTTNGQTTNAPGLLSVQVVKEDGRWKISELKPV